VTLPARWALAAAHEASAAPIAATATVRAAAVFWFLTEQTLNQWLRDYVGHAGTEALREWHTRHWGPLRAAVYAARVPQGPCLPMPLSSRTRCRA
jgi:hypothetical protein